MFCKYCGRKIPEGSVCTCQQAQVARAQQQAKSEQQPANSAQQQTTAGNNQPAQSYSNYSSQSAPNYQAGGNRQQAYSVNNGTPNSNHQMNGQSMRGQQSQINGQIPNQSQMNGQMPNQSQMNGQMPKRSQMPNSAPVQDKAQKKDKLGMMMFIISLAVSVVGIIAFVLLRFVLADTLTDRAGDIIQYLMYIIPGILGIAGCVFAVFSLQSDKIRIMSIIAIAVGAIVTIFVIVSMIVFPYEGKTSHTKNDDQDAFAIEETKDASNEADTETDAEETQNEGTAAIDAMLQNYELNKDYAQAKQALNALDVNTLSGDDANRVIDFQNTIENDLRTEMQGYADSSDYTSLFSKLQTYEITLGSDSLLEEIRNTYEADYIVYLDEQTHALAEDGKKDEALSMLEQARTYLSDASVVDDMKETVEKLGSDYIIPDSDSRYVSRSELAGYTLQEINYAKNEIYARHGRQFASKELQDYFNSKSWYNGTISPSSFSESVFNDYERKNIQTLKEEEFSRDSRGYQLDQ